jgi:hypothetical protein
MKNIDIRHIKRKAEIAAEAYVALRLAELYEQNTQCILHESCTSKKLSSNYQQYLANCKLNMTAKNVKVLDVEMEKQTRLSRSTAESVFNSCHGVISFDGDLVNIQNYNKLGLKEGIAQKADLKIEVLNIDGSPRLTKMFSVKQYEKFNNPQVCSGTYASTLAGLAFDNVGRGKFRSVLGEEFLSKDRSKTREMFAKHYGVVVCEYIDQMYEAQHSLSKWQKTLVYPGDAKWKQICLETAKNAIPAFIKALDIIYNSNPSAFKARLLARSGLTGEDEIVYTALKGKAPITFNTFSDASFGTFIKNLSKKETKCDIIEHGQGVRMTIKGADNSDLLDIDMPLTVNKNGAWVMAKDGRYCKKSKKWCEYLELRPMKAKEMATSTNTWLRLKEAVFLPILKKRQNIV